MTNRRVITSVLIASCSLVAGLAQAQQEPSGSYRMPNFSGGQARYASPFGDPYQSGGPGNALYQQPAGMQPGVRPATYGGGMHPAGRLGQRLLGRGEGPNDYIGPTDPRMPPHFATPGTAVPGVGYYGQDGIVTRQIPDEDSWDEEGPLERIISTAFKNSWVRFEYLLWDIRPESSRMGANLANGVNLDGFAFDNNGDLLTDGIARVLTMSGLTLNDNNGARVTVGLPVLFGGDLEVSAFILDQAGDNISAPDLPSDPTAVLPNFIATTTLTNGLPGGTILLYDRSFDVSYESSVWGGDVKYVFDTGVPGPGLKVRPMVGVRYLNITEGMTQKGVFDGFGTLTPLTSVIESTTENHLFGSLVGGRIEFQHPWFTIGAEPRIGLGVNRYNARVRTSNLRSVNDGKFTTEEDDMIFSPVVEGNVYGRIHVSENFTLHGGFQWIYAAEVTRPANNIYYNDNGLNNPPGVIVKSKTEEYFIQGLTVGCEIKF